MDPKKQTRNISRKKKNSDEITDDKSPLVKRTKRMKLKSNQSNANDSSEDTCNSNDSTETELVKHYRQLSEVLSQKYVNIVDRLKLDFTPNCVHDADMCVKRHSKNCSAPVIINETIKSKLYHLLSEKHFFSFLKVVDDCTTQSIFVGGDVLASMIKLILTINPSKHDLHQNDYIINECSLVFNKVITQFPPCWYAIRSHYISLMERPIATNKYLSSDKNTSQSWNIFEFIVAMLNEQIRLPNVSTDGLDETGESSMTEYLNFHDWETRQTNAQCLDTLDRDEQINRLFIALELLMTIFQLDISIWNLRYLSRPSKHLFDNEKPLIASATCVKEYNPFSDVVRKTIKLFVVCTAFQYPDTKIDILSRFISLFAIFINLRDIKYSSNGVAYPCIGSDTKAFIKEIRNQIENSIRNNVTKYLMVIDSIKVPFIKFLLIDNLLSKFNNHSGEMSPKKIFENLKKRRWIECDYEPKNSNRNIITQPTMKYPSIESIDKTKTNEIYREKYLQILLDALKSYCKFFATKEFAEILMNKKIDKIDSKPKTNNLISGILNLEKIERDIEKLEKKINFKEKRKFHVASIFYDNIHVDQEKMIKYNEDIKYMMLLKANIPLLMTNFGEEFINWKDFIYNFFLVNE